MSISYDEVIIDPVALETSKVHPTIIKRTIDKWKADSSHLKKRGPNDKWSEVGEWEGERYLINFRNESGKCVVTRFRKAHYSKTYWKTEKKTEKKSEKRNE